MFNVHIYIYIYTHMHIYIYIYVCRQTGAERSRISKLPRHFLSTTKWCVLIVFPLNEGILNRQRGSRSDKTRQRTARGGIASDLSGRGAAHAPINEALRAFGASSPRRWARDCLPGANSERMVYWEASVPLTRLTWGDLRRTLRPNSNGNSNGNGNSNSNGNGNSNSNSNSNETVAHAIDLGWPRRLPEGERLYIIR